MDLVFKFGCRKPVQEALALQLLGQAWLYRETIRQIHNKVRAEVASAIKAGDDSSHVVKWLYEGLSAKIRRARSRRGHLVDHGTYWLIDDEILAASKATEKLGPIGMRPWDETGRIGAAIQSKTQFPADAWDHSRVQLSAPDRRGHALLQIWVGEMKNARAIVWPIKLHRSFPAGAIVKQVAVQRIRLGWRFRWQALVTISVPDRLHEDPAAKGTVGIDVGWRDEGVRGQRISTHDADDDAGDLHIDAREGLLRSDELRSLRDELFDMAKAYAQETGVPGAENAKLWKSKKRLHLVATKSEDFGLAWWRHRDRHIEDMERGVRSTVLARRRERVREYADALARRYEVVALEDMPMQDWVTRGATSDLERKRATAALSELQAAMTHRFGPGRVDWVPAEYTTMTCADCGAVKDQPVGARVHWTCECGREHHQDFNAAKIIRDRSERWRGDGKPVRARSRKPKPKMTKRERKAKKKDLDNRGARKPIANAAE